MRSWANFQHDKGLFLLGRRDLPRQSAALNAAQLFSQQLLPLYFVIHRKTLLPQHQKDVALPRSAEMSRAPAVQFHRKVYLPKGLERFHADYQDTA